MAYAIITDVSVRLGRPITEPDEVAQVNAWLGDVEGLILERIPDLTDQVAAGTITSATLVRIECTAVIRKIKNPGGYSSETIDDYTYRYNEAARRGDLFLTDDEWSALLSPAGGAQGAFTINPYGAGPDTVIRPITSTGLPSWLDWT